MNHDALKTIFISCTTPESRYQKIIELGRQLPPFNPDSCIPENLVSGCQSIMHLEVTEKDGKLFFNADSEALISKGLAALLILAYSGQTPETILSTPPTFLKEIGIEGSLSPARSNGLANLYLKMKQEAVCYLKQTSLRL